MDAQDPSSNQTPTLGPGTWAAEGAIDGWRDFSDRVCAALAWGAAHPMDMLWSDPDFRAWPIGDRAVVAALQHWALTHSGRRITVLLAEADTLVRQHPRWLAWRRDWTHRVAVNQADEAQRAEVPALLLLGQDLGLRMIEPLRGRGLWSRDPATLRRWRDEIDVILQRSHAAAPATTLGL